MAITTADSLLGLLEKSRLLDSEQMEKARESAEKAGDARALAKQLIKQEVLTRWQAGQLLAGRTAFFLGKYKLVDLIGRGGMGNVFLARHTMMNRDAALKIIAKHLGSDPANLDRFFTEARAVAALNHPNIVHAYSIDNEGDRYYMVMEYVDGQDLQRIVEEKGPLDFGSAADYIRQASEGLGHAHKRNIIHCDIKPANLLINSQGIVKILDMGMARLVSADGKGDESDEKMLGTIDYMSPELAVHSPDLDHRADIYSLGCTCYFLLTGHPPFPEGTLAERIVKHQTEEPGDIASQRPDTPGELIEICTKMMAKKPEDRYQSAEEVSRLLAAWKPKEPESMPDNGQVAGVAVASKPGTTKPAPGASKPRKQWSFPALDRRQKIIAAAAGGAVLLILVGTVGAWMLFSGEETAEADPQAAKPPVEEASAPAVKEDLKVPDIDASMPSEDDLAAALGLDSDPRRTKPAAEPAVAPETKPAEQPPAAKAVEEKPAASKPAESAAKEPGDAGAKPAEAKMETAKTAESKTEAAKPAEKAAEKPKETEAAEAKPAAKPPAKKAEDPLRALPQTVDLPLLGEDDSATQPFQLGAISTGPDVEWQLYLLGGDVVMGRSRKYTLDRAERDNAKASWSIKLESSLAGKETEAKDVARLWRQDNTLIFQWVDGATAGEANYLKNCLLQIRVQGNSRYLALCTPLAVEPIPLDIERGTAKGGFSAKWLPDNDAMKIEITGVEGPKTYQIDPSGPFAPKTQVHLTYVYKDRANNDNPGPKFRIVFQARSSGVTADLRMVESPMNFKQLAMSLRQFGADGADGARNAIMTEQDKIQKQMANAKGGPREQFDAQLRKLDMELWYVNFYAEMQAGAKLHYRVFLPVQDKQVVLASTEPGPPAQPAAAQAAAK